MKKYIIFAILVVIFGGCASYQPPKEYNFNKTRIYNQKFDDIWDKAIKYFTDNNIPVMSMDKNSGFIISEYLSKSNLTSDCYDCGKGFITNPLSDNHAKINVYLKNSSHDSTEVMVTTFFIADVDKGKGLSRIDCSSTGKFEKQFFDYLDRR